MADYVSIKARHGIIIHCTISIKSLRWTMVAPPPVLIVTTGHAKPPLAMEDFLYMYIYIYIYRLRLQY